MVAGIAAAAQQFAGGKLSARASPRSSACSASGETPANKGKAASRASASPWLHSTLASAAWTRAAPQILGGVGFAPGAAMSEPSPSLQRHRARRRCVSVTVPCATKTPITPLLGPANTRVPRTMMSPKAPFSRTGPSEGVLSSRIAPPPTIKRPAGVDQIFVDEQRGVFAEPDDRVVAERETGARHRRRRDVVADEDVVTRGEIAPAFGAACGGRAAHFFNQARAGGRRRGRRLKSQETEQDRRRVRSPRCGASAK